MLCLCDSGEAGPVSSALSTTSQS